MTITADDWKALYLEAEGERRRLLKVIDEQRQTIKAMGRGAVAAAGASFGAYLRDTLADGDFAPTMPDGSTQLVPSDVAALPEWAKAIWQRAFPPVMIAPGSGPSASPMGGGPKEPTPRELISMFKEIARLHDGRCVEEPQADV